MPPRNKGVVLSDPNSGYQAAVDPIHMAQAHMGSVHRKIHEGLMFSHVENQTLADGGQIRKLMVPASGYAFHMIAIGQASNKVNIAIYEGCSYSAPGSQTVVPVNHNRAASQDLQATWVNSFTIQATGTNLLTYHVPAGQRGGGVERRGNEFIFNKDTPYLVVLESEAASNDCVLDVEFYEQPLTF